MSIVKNKLLDNSQQSRWIVIRIGNQFYFSSSAKLKQYMIFLDEFE